MAKPSSLHDRELAPELPLTPAVFHILMALADGEKHGYAIMQTVTIETGRAIQMGPGTLYGSLDRMLRARFIEESEEQGEPGGHSERRRYYRLTDFGQRALRAEVRRLEQALTLARRKKLTLRHRITHP
jgi:DNA-binding PadR family transcriptional regulator